MDEGLLFDCVGRATGGGGGGGGGGGDQEESGCSCGVDGERSDPSTPPGRCPAPHTQKHPSWRGYSCGVEGSAATRLDKEVK